MLRLYSGNAILAKIRAIFGKRLTRADYAQMARKRDVGEVAALLKENGIAVYGESEIEALLSQPEPDEPQQSLF